MIFAIFLARAKMGFMGNELEIMLLASSILFAFSHGGAFSLSGFCRCKCHKEGKGECKKCKIVGCGTEDKCCGEVCEVKENTKK
jgi:hypothetical protein